MDIIAHQDIKVRIDDSEQKRIAVSVIENMSGLGGSKFVSNGKLMEHDPYYHGSPSSTELREATEFEIACYEVLMCIQHPSRLEKKND